MTTKQESDRGRDDIRLLMERPEFRRFCFRILESSGIYASTYGAEVAVLFAEGRRSLGLEILDWITTAYPLSEPSSVPVNAMLAILTEEFNSRATKEATDGTRSGHERYDRNREIGYGSDDADG
jgi:hypothetical protein